MNITALALTPLATSAFAPAPLAPAGNATAAAAAAADRRMILLIPFGNGGSFRLPLIPPHYILFIALVYLFASFLETHVMAEDWPAAEAAFNRFMFKHLHWTPERGVERPEARERREREEAEEAEAVERGVRRSMDMMEEKMLRAWRAAEEDRLFGDRQEWRLDFRVKVRFPSALRSAT